VQRKSWSTGHDRACNLSNSVQCQCCLSAALGKTKRRWAQIRRKRGSLAGIRWAVKLCGVLMLDLDELGSGRKKQLDRVELER
jgi:hypothetical protein